MTLDYTVKYASKIANRFKLASKTNRAAGHEYEFTGAKSVKIYSMVPAELTDYQRGGKRYGDVTDLEYTTQEMLCTQAKAFTKHLEALDGSDIAVETAAGKFLRMEIDERVVPMMDKYRLKKWVMGAATLKQMTSTPTKNTIVGDIMDLKGKMGDNLVPDTGLTLYISTTYFVLLKQADAIVGLEDMGTKAVKDGSVGTFDGMNVVPVPSSWLPSGVYFMIKAKGTSADPVKLTQYDVIKKSVGFSGPVVQGLVYYDAFVLGTKAVGIGVAGSAAAVLAAPEISVSSHAASIKAVSGVTFRYTVDGTDPRSSTTAETYSSAVTLTEGQTMRAIGTKDGCVGIEATKDYE